MAADESGMVTEITVADSPIQFQDWQIDIPTSPVDVAPSATVTTNASESISANDELTITIDGTVRFTGKTRSGGTKSQLGGTDIKAAHPVRDVFEETVSISLTAPDTAQILNEALDQTEDGATFSTDYPGTPIPLDNDYEVENRSVKRIFRDVMDRTSRVWWVDPAGDIIHVAPVGNGGQWLDLDTQADSATLQRFDEGNIDSVRNAVTVIGTGEQSVTGTASDQTSIDTYGRRTGNSPYKVSYITSQSEAAAYASELLVPDPLPEGTLLVGANVGDVTGPLVNQTVDVTDTGKNVDADGLVIEQQSIQQGRAELQIGAGSGVSIEDLNRNQSSRDDNAQPGSVYDSDRIADGAVQQEKLVDGSVITEKLADLAVELEKVGDGAIDTVKIQDDAIEAPKILAGEVTAEKLNTELARAERLLAGDIEAQDIRADTLTANEIDTLDLQTGQLFIGIDAQTGFQFDVSAANNWVRMYPSADGAFCQIGLDARPIASVTSESTTATNFVGAGTLTKDESNSSFEAQPQGGNTTDKLAVTDYSSLDVSDTVALLPLTDQTGVVGGNGRAWEQIHAYEYIDAGTGNAINDGGDPLAGLAEGRGPPDHAKRTDEKGDVKGYSLTDMARSAWDVIRAQQDRIEAQQERIADLEERLSEIESKV